MNRKLRRQLRNASKRRPKKVEVIAEKFKLPVMLFACLLFASVNLMEDTGPVNPAKMFHPHRMHFNSIYELREA